MIRTRNAIAAVMALALIDSATAVGDLVVPGNLETVEGDTQNGFPFSPGTFGSLVPNLRYQQVYAASEFGAGPLRITGLRFRPGAVLGAAFSSTLPDIQIDLSTTLAGPDALSMTFAANVGADNVTVFARGPLSLSSSNTGSPTRDFDIYIPCTTPFTYLPSLGNLLLDVRNFGGGTTTLFDADWDNGVPGDSISRVTTFGGGVFAATADIADTVGLVTQFEIGVAAVPEPSGLAPCGLGVMGLLGIARWRRRRGPDRDSQPT